MPTLSDESALAPTVAREGEPSEGVEPAGKLGLQKIDRKRVLAALFEDGHEQPEPEPECFGRFRVVRSLGRGGMGTVVEAHDPQLDRPVAIKVLHERADGGQQRLMREAQALAQLSHPNVIQVFETGEAGGRLFIAMELVRGRSLKDWQQQPHPWLECLEVYLQAGRGLAAAHGVAIVHRDFKPANCIIDDVGRVRVLDFGLARGRAEGEQSEVGELLDAPGLTTAQEPGVGATLASTSSRRVIDERLTQTGTLLGTPAYMAPEQARRATADARSDQYAFCVALYEAAHGQRPFAGAGGVLGRNDGDPPPFEMAPSHADLPRPPGWLRQVLTRGLAPGPDDRFATMKALLEAVEGHLRARRRRRLVLAVSGGLAAVSTIALAGIGIGLEVRDAARSSECEALGASIGERWAAPTRERLAAAFAEVGGGSTWTRVEPRLDAWTAAWREARADACLAAYDDPEPARRSAVCLDRGRWELEALLDVFGAPDRTTVLEAVTAAADLPAIERCGDLLGLVDDVSLQPVEPEQQAQGIALRRGLARVLALERAGQYDEALALAHDSVQQARAQGDPVVEAEALAKLGTVQWHRTELAQAEQTLQRGHFLASRVEHDRVAYQTARDLAWVVGVRLARPSEGRVWLEHARSDLARSGEDPELDPELLVMLGELEDVEGRPEQALEAHQRALALREQRLGADHPEIADSLINLGRIQGALGDPRALGTLERARSLAASTLGPNHPKTADADHELGVVLAGRGRVDEGIAAYRRALEVRERALGPNDPGLAVMLSNLAAALNMQGGLDESLRLLERSVAILEHAWGPDHPDTVVAAINLGVAEAEVGRVREGIARLRAALVRAERAFGAGDPTVAATLVNLAHWLETTGAVQEAIPLRLRAIEVDQAQLGPDHASVAGDYEALARDYLRIDDAERALASHERALEIRGRARPADPAALARAHDGVALALLALERVDEAIEQHARALELRPEDDAGPRAPSDLSGLRAELARLRSTGSRTATP